MQEMMIKYKEGFKYQLHESYSHNIPELVNYSINTPYLFVSNGVLQILKGYAWDGPSGPTFDSKTFMRGSLVHDALYQLIREGHLPESFRAIADKYLKNICKEDRMNRLRAWWVYNGVRLFAGFAAHKSNRKVVQIAP